MAYRSNAQVKSGGGLRFDKFRAAIGAAQAAVDPAKMGNKAKFLDFLDREVVAFYRSRGGAISVVTGALRRALTATNDSAREVTISGRTIRLVILHPGAAVWGAPKVMPVIDLGKVAAEATRKYHEWEKSQ